MKTSYYPDLTGRGRMRISAPVADRVAQVTLILVGMGGRRSPVHGQIAEFRGIVRRFAIT